MSDQRNNANTSIMYLSCPRPRLSSPQREEMERCCVYVTRYAIKPQISKIGRCSIPPYALIRVILLSNLIYIYLSSVKDINSINVYGFLTDDGYDEY